MHERDKASFPNVKEVGSSARPREVQMQNTYLLSPCDEIAKMDKIRGLGRVLTGLAEKRQGFGEG